jgi:hypothetical protein
LIALDDFCKIPRLTILPFPLILVSIMKSLGPLTI